jgi:CRP/FNR family cyclic AMP-dependent transcriptional regulator
MADKILKYSTKFMVKCDFVNHQTEIKVKVHCDTDGRESSIVQGFDVEKVAQLYGATEIVRLRSGNFLFREGDEGDALYIVKSGTLRIMNGSIVYETVRAGGIVGEMALVDRGMPRSASVIAATSAELIKIDVPKFLALIASAPDFALTVMGVMARRIRIMNSRYRPNPSS